MSTEAPKSAMTPSDYLAAEVRAELARRNLSIAKFAETLGRPYVWTVRRVGQSRSIDVTLDEAAEIAAGLGWDLVDVIDSPRVLTAP